MFVSCLGLTREEIIPKECDSKLDDVPKIKFKRFRKNTIKRSLQRRFNTLLLSLSCNLFSYSYGLDLRTEVVNDRHIGIRSMNGKKYGIKGVGSLFLLSYSYNTLNLLYYLLLSTCQKLQPLYHLPNYITSILK